MQNTIQILWQMLQASLLITALVIVNIGVPYVLFVLPKRNKKEILNQIRIHTCRVEENLLDYYTGEDSDKNTVFCFKEDIVDELIADMIAIRDYTIKLEKVKP